MARSTQERYRDWRRTRPEFPARTALAIVRAEDRQSALMDRFGSWEFETGEYATFAYADLEIAGYTIRASVGDDDQPYDWGDMEPTEEERDNVSAFYVSVQVLEDGREIYQDGIGGVDAIDLPGYSPRDWEGAAAMALDEYLLRGAEDFVATETRERAEWAARDTVTIDA